MRKSTLRVLFYALFIVGPDQTGDNTVGYVFEVSVSGRDRMR